MKEKVESHPDANSRKEMLQQMHSRAGQKTEAASGQTKTPSSAKQKPAPDATPPSDEIQ